MLRKKKRTSSSFGPDGRRMGATNTTCSSGTKMHSSNRLFQPGRRLVVQRAPCLPFLNNASLSKPFQRPMTKRRAYNKGADQALKQSSLGPKRRMDGMAKLLARAGRGLHYKLPQKRTLDESGSTEESESEEEQEEERPFEPLCLWTSPHEGGDARGLPPSMVTEMQPDEYGVEEEVTVLRPAPIERYSKNSVYCPPILAKWLRPHQREGLQFMYECVMNLKNYKGQGCILADDMGLGKTLQSVALIYTLLKTSITSNGQPTAKRVIVICPCSLVKNWENEFTKWLGPGGVKCMALAESDRKTVEKNLDLFVRTNMFQILIASYETIRTHVKRLSKSNTCCDLLVCDEAHRLKNSENQTSRALNSLPVTRRVLLTGTPMQNDLNEFFSMVDFINPGVLGTPEEFRRTIEGPILRGREPHATDAQKQRMSKVQNDMSTTVNEFILRRVNTLNAEHLPPKLVQVVCCNLTEIQQNMYQHLVHSKAAQHVLDGKQVNCLGSIQMLMKLCNHPRLVVEDDSSGNNKPGRRAAANKAVKYTDDDATNPAATPGADGIAKFLPYEAGGGGRGMHTPVRPEWSGKMFVLYRLMREMRKPGNGSDKIVIVSNYTQTLDLIGKMCRENSWGFCRLDGSITMKKRQKMVDDFNDPSSSLIAFLLSSKAGGCGLNLIGGNRLVLFDPDWNPAVDKQAAARCWRDGQKKRCFTYRFLATGTVEEKIFQRQLSKEGLQSVVDDKEQVNTLSTKDLRNLFKFRSGTPSDTHDKLRCERCKIIADHVEVEEAKVLPKKLAACRELLARIEEHEDAAFFLKTLVPAEHGVTQEEYEKLVKQPMDLATIRGKLALAQGAPSAYGNVSGFSKDVNRIFSNVVKVWSPGQEIADAARRLQSWWVEEWTALVPVLMTMKSDADETSQQEEHHHGDEEDGLAAQCVERGEDYQEQIGMPDEENMRSWSHHHGADTVDDPVFRAAMRGCDAVSFVFGLEVTWSLIKERQELDEEREAMKALEALQAMEEEKGNDGEDEDSDGEAADDEANDQADVDNDATQSDSSDEEMEDAGEPEKSTPAAETSESSTHKDALEDSESEADEMEEKSDVAPSSPDRSESSSDEKQQESSDEDASSPERPPTKTGKSSPDESTATESSFSSSPDQPSPNPAASSPESDPDIAKSSAPGGSQDTEASGSSRASRSLSALAEGPWACAACTFENKPKAKKCSICKTNRPPKAKKRRVLLEDSDSD